MNSSKEKVLSASVVREPKIEEAVKAHLAGDRAAFQTILSYVEPLIKQVLRSKTYPRLKENNEDARQECGAARLIVSGLNFH